MRKPTNIVWKTIEDSGSVVLDLESGRYYSLNDTALAAWIYLESGLSPAATAKRVASAYGVDELEVRNDVQEFVGKLMVQGLLEEGEPQVSSGRADTATAKPLPRGGGYVKLEISAHDAVQTVTAGTSGGYYYGGGYTYYYYYYY